MALKPKLDMNDLPSEIHNVPMIRLAGTLDIFSAQDLRKHFERLAKNEDIKTIILLVEDLEYIDSSGIGILFSAGIKYKKRGGAVILVKPQEMVYGALQITRALTQITVLESLEEYSSILPSAGH